MDRSHGVWGQALFSFYLMKTGRSRRLSRHPDEKTLNFLKISKISGKLKKQKKLKKFLRKKAHSAPPALNFFTERIKLTETVPLRTREVCQKSDFSS